MHVTQLWRYPVKSMIGSTVDRVELVETGVVGDRTWAARDLEHGGIRGAKKHADLMTLAAEPIDDGHVRVTLPDGGSVTTRDPDVDTRISAVVGTSVRLEALRPADDLDHYRRGPMESDDIVAELRGIFGRTEDEPLPDLSVFPPVTMEFESPPGTYYDAFPLLVLTESALEALTAAVPDSVVDVRRFRPSIVIGGADPGHPEFEWVGRRAELGAAEIEFVVPCPRCVMVTRAIDHAVPADRAILRHIVRDLDQNLGVYARVTRPGSVTVGDALALR
jgi:hypothetical protein